MFEPLEHTCAEIDKRLDILSRLLLAGKDVHPPACNCAIKSRDVERHSPHCSYRVMKHTIGEIRTLVEAYRGRKSCSSR